MKLSGWLVHLATRAIAESMDVRSMVKLARRFIMNYDIYARTGFQHNIPVPNIDAATQIVKDIHRNEMLLELIALLIQMQDSGLKGKRYIVPHMRDIFREVKKLGLLFDAEVGMFLEDSRVRKTRNWGVLRENEEYIFTFLIADIVDSTSMVRNYPEEIVQGVYEDLKSMINPVIEKRNGRIWNWAGDGMLAAFYFSNKNNNAVTCAMDIINEIYVYNLLRCPLDQPLEVRMAVHSGPCGYREVFHDLKDDTIEKIIEIEKKFTDPNSVTISSSVFQMLSQILVEAMTPVTYNNYTTYYTYKLQWEG
jgi:hypothetical protein